MKKKVKLVRCTRCLMPETRPRIHFNKKGVCYSCLWADEKKTKVDWKARWKELEKYCDKYRSKTGNYDVLVPVSGGKDSCYVTYRLKHDLGMHPLTISVVPPLTFKIGDANLDNFIKRGYDCIKIYPNPIVGRRISTRGFIEVGQPLMSWITSVQVGVLKAAMGFKIPFIMFGEEGDTEYGGNTVLKNKPFYGIDYSIKVYLSNNNPNKYRDEFSQKELHWWLYPSKEEFKKSKLAITHWSYYENWDPYQHYILAKEKFGLKERNTPSVGTYTNYAQTDTCLFDLHCYLMYLKFGFGRCAADTCFDIRRGALDRIQAVELVKKFDNAYPEPYIKQYLKFFDMTKKKFDKVLDKHANKKLFYKVKGKWMPKFDVE